MNDSKDTVTNYCLGFVFDLEHEKVALIRKTSSHSQIRYLNGVGGKVEESETSLEAMIRECEEETTLLIAEWKLYANMHSPLWDIDVFAAESHVDLSTIDGYRTSEGIIEIHHTSDVLSKVMVTEHLTPELIGLASKTLRAHVGVFTNIVYDKEVGM